MQIIDSIMKAPYYGTSIQETIIQTVILSKFYVFSNNMNLAILYIAVNFCLCTNVRDMRRKC